MDTLSLEALQTAQTEIKSLTEQVALQQWTNEEQHAETVAMCIESSEQLDLIINIVMESNDQNGEINRAAATINSIFEFIETAKGLCNV